jgi:hypothetical protein
MQVLAKEKLLDSYGELGQAKISLFNITTIGYMPQPTKDLSRERVFRTGARNF